MTTYLPVKKNDPNGWIGYVSLAPLTATGQWQANPTLAAGDVKLYGDGVLIGNLATLPDAQPDGSKIIRIILSQAETNYDNIVILFSDQTAPPEWTDLLLHLQTVTRRVDDLNDLSAAQVNAEVDTALADYDGPTNAELATALAAADDAVLTQVALVKAKTDSLTFTVAGKVDANIHRVNDIQVDGSGTTGDPWGPV